jgi:hypothetical protein
MDTAVSILSKIVALLGPAANSIKGHVNTKELLRVTITALISGGGLLGVLTAYSGDLSSLVIGVTPPVLSIIGFILTFVIDLVRRLNHGAPAPAPAPAPGPVGPDNFPV